MCHFGITGSGAKAMWLWGAAGFRVELAAAEAFRPYVLWPPIVAVGFRSRESVASSGALPAASLPGAWLAAGAASANSVYAASVAMTVDVAGGGVSGAVPEFEVSATESRSRAPENWLPICAGRDAWFSIRFSEPACEG